MSEQLGTVLYYLSEKLEKNAFISFVEENYDNFEDINRLLSLTYDDEEHLDFKSFVELAIQTLKPDYDGKVYVTYNEYYQNTEDGEELVYPLEQQYEQTHLNQVLELLNSLSVDLKDRQEQANLVLFVLDSGSYTWTESDKEGNDVEISIKEPELHNPYQDTYDDKD